MKTLAERGVQQAHIDLFFSENSVSDFEVDNNLKRLFKAGLLSKENGYDDPEAILNSGEDKQKRRRTMEELNSMI